MVVLTSLQADLGLNPIFYVQLKNFVRHDDLVICTPDSQSVGAGSNLGSGVADHHGQDVHSQMSLHTNPFIPPGWINWYQFRLGINVLCATKGTACG
jgi:hypothetical protein